MHNVLAQLQVRYPTLHFIAGEQFCWSPETNEILYKTTPHELTDIWSLLHESGHALLQHQSYKGDFELLRLEVAAWDKARLIAEELQLKISEEHIENCLDTYRDWLYRRSICPRCSTKCLQQDDHHSYHCFNCHSNWQVSSSRFCRAYRRTTTTKPLALVPVFNDTL
jgi:hypothetical protein